MSEETNSYVIIVSFSSNILFIHTDPLNSALKRRESKSCSMLATKTGAHLAHCQTNMMECFCKNSDIITIMIVITTFAKRSIINIGLGPKYASEKHGFVISSSVESFAQQHPEV